MTEHPRKPIGFALETDDDRQASVKASSGRARASIEFAPDFVQPPAVIPPMATLPASRKFRWGTILVSAVGALVVMWAGLGISQLIEDLFARSPVLGWFASGLAGLAGLAALAIVAREIWGLARL